ncbi:hypothetical protein DTO013E5_5152 [Penicillium roqueforti]|uniref:uncharacterized protein n=1 Tax=Penicillium roqueforti TaxID=5082 RepID=UPI0019091CDB|nr:uncharacterized protein LCP9604111_5599 [Penicillium roqueforti]KAF9248344.1 hypothetical protein LCP9604111_5599 [Penicillium roqueforti]KAI1836202.1 hypothetical protein CBS147337_3351 [Penicillium roqueforti]KAI2683225.1 hypothetical protein CBS147355_2365 [Penicillium roqueforti]KAI2701793.1 hypothetical protein CBS147372_4846 [Penicillium roqueforti]KAI2722224.1 hypothetical protein CBS147318_2839 [Penicillium roqueforti]
MRESLCEGVRSMSVDGYTEGNIDEAVASALLMDAILPGSLDKKALWGVVVCRARRQGHWPLRTRIVAVQAVFCAAMPEIIVEHSKATLNRLYSQDDENALRSSVSELRLVPVLDDDD